MLAEFALQEAVRLAEAAVVDRLRGGDGPSLLRVLEQLYEETHESAWLAATAAAVAAGARPEAMYAAGVLAGVWPDAPMVPLEGVEAWAQQLAEKAVDLQVNAWGTAEWSPRWVAAFVVFAGRDCVLRRAQMPRPAPTDRTEAVAALRDEMLVLVTSRAT